MRSKNRPFIPVLCSYWEGSAHEINQIRIIFEIALELGNPLRVSAVKILSEEVAEPVEQLSA